MNQLAVVTKMFPSEPEGDLEYCNGQPGNAFAEWLKILLIKYNYDCDEPIQEDYGWGFWIKYQDAPIWVCVSFGGEEDDKDGWWVISCQYDSPFAALLPWKWKKKNLAEQEAKKIIDIVSAEIEITKEIELAPEGTI